MEIKLEDIEGDAYQNFKDSVRNKETFRKYNSYLNHFLQLIPNDMYKRYLTYEPRSREVQELATCFTEIAQKNVKVAKSIIQAYVRDLKKQIEEKTISAGTAKNRLKPIKALLNSNDIEISWYLVDKSLPLVGKSTDRAYTRDELQRMMKRTVDLADKIIITGASSAGFRLEAWDYFTWSDVIIFYEDDNTIKGGAIRVYHGDIEEYWTHTTPEFCKYVLLYKEEWKNRFFKYPLPKDPFLVSVRFPYPKRLRANGVKTRTENFVSAIGLRPKLEPGQKRHAVMLDHGFRKYNNTMMRRAKVNLADLTDMQGRDAGGQQGSYERYVEADFERFAEYQKAIPYLTIDDTERNNLELQKERAEKNALKKKIQENTTLERKLEEEKEARLESEKQNKQALAQLREEILKND